MSAAGFWTRRKAGVEAESAALAEAEATRTREADEARQAHRTDEELLAEAGLRDPDEIESPEEVREMLASALPQRLKTRALRRLWRLNPVLANVDGLVDYGEDFTDAATVVENLQTAYQVGRGMLKSIEDKAERARALAAVDGETEGAGPGGHAGDRALAETNSAQASSTDGATGEQAAFGATPDPEDGQAAFGPRDTASPAEDARARGDAIRTGRSLPESSREPAEQEAVERTPDGNPDAVQTHPGETAERAPLASRRMRFAFAER